MWFGVRVSHSPNHVTHWSNGHVICKKSFISTFARTMATNFSKVWLKLSWPQPPTPVTHLSCDHVVFAKSCISSFTTPMTLNLVGLWVTIKGPHLLFRVTCQSNDLLLFENRHVSPNARQQNSSGDIKHRKSHKSKAFFVIQKIVIFNSHRYTPL